MARAVVTIPAALSSGASAGSSFRDLLLDSGYCLFSRAITVGMLEGALREHPEQVENWLAWSDNKRTDSGWYFRRRGLGGVEVGYFPFRADRPSISFSEKEIFRACAQFIKFEIDDICEY